MNAIELTKWFLGFVTGFIIGLPIGYFLIKALLKFGRKKPSKAVAFDPEATSWVVDRDTIVEYYPDIVMMDGRIIKRPQSAPSHNAEI